MYFGFIHATFGNNNVGDHAIRAHMVIFSTTPMGAVAVSSSLSIPSALLKCYKHGTVPWDVQFPSTFTLLGESARAAQHLLLGVHIRDSMASLLHVDLHGAMEDILKELAGACLKKGTDGKCTQWQVFKDGQLDAALKKGIVE